MSVTFPPGFLWGCATAAHQVEGDNTGSDWWEWEHRGDSPVAEPSGNAIDHYRRFAADIELLGSLGFGVYRFSVEWARVEPEEGRFDQEALDHYRQVADEVCRRGMVPIVTLHHFTLPRWMAADGGWVSPRAPERFARYSRAVVSALGDRVARYCTINEPGILAFGGYLGALGWPPGTTDLDSWMLAINGLRKAHVAARDAVKETRPGASVGATHSMAEYEANPAGRPIMEYLRRHTEDLLLEVCADDDFIGVQTYTRIPVSVPGWLGPATRALVRWSPLRRTALPPLIRSQTKIGRPTGDDGIRRTDMGYEFRPQAVAATVRRVAKMFPGKEILVTEHGIATDDDTQRVEFITEGLRALHAVVEDGIPLRGYLHWSAFDNFEWALGYRMRFGLVAVDRTTQERTPKPSARFLGEIARSGTVP